MPAHWSYVSLVLVNYCQAQGSSLLANQSVFLWGLDISEHMGHTSEMVFQESIYLRVGEVSGTRDKVG